MLDCIEVLKTSKKVLCAPLLCDRVAWSYCNCITFLNSQTSILLYQLQKHLPHRSTHNTKFIYICMQYSKVANLEKTSFFHSIWPTQPAKAPKLFPFGQVLHGSSLPKESNTRAWIFRVQGLLPFLFAIKSSQVFSPMFKVTACSTCGGNAVRLFCWG